MPMNGGFLIEEREIQRRVKELAKEIEKDYYGKNPIFVGVLKGSFIFLADLIRNINYNVEVEFLGVSSYGKSTETSGVVKIVKDLSVPIENRHVLLVEDIVDTGLTLDYIYKMLLSKKPKTLRIVVLLDKRPRRIVDVPLHYVGFQVPDEFLVGYGLDFAEHYRNLPYVRALLREEIEEIKSKWGIKQ